MISLEQAIIGTMLNDDSLFREDIPEELFSEPAKLIYREMKKLHKEEGKTFSLLQIIENLKDEIPIEYFNSILKNTSYINFSNAESELKSFIRELQETKVKESVFKELKALSEEPKFDLERFKKILTKADIPETETEDSSIEFCLKEFIGLTTSKSPGITLGLPTIDRATRGFRFGEILLIMARTTVGKTFLALNILKNIVSTHTEKIGFFSLEMPKESITERLWQIYFNLNAEQVLAVSSNLEYQEEFLNTFKNVEIFSNIYSIEEIRRIIKNKNLRIIFIDFLDLIKTEFFSSLYLKTTSLITDIKKLAKEENVLIILVHQLSREAEDGSIPVRLNMARDSGAVEEKSDFVIGLWRPEIDEESGEKFKNKMIVKLLKNKRGDTKLMECHFDKQTGRILEITNEY
ncbi:MAG: DnaB-like helicase C-terminal domain-containing protein [Acidobacteriota bacterium]